MLNDFPLEEVLLVGPLVLQEVLTQHLFGHAIQRLKKEEVLRVRDLPSWLGGQGVQLLQMVYHHRQSVKQEGPQVRVALVHLLTPLGFVVH